MRHLTLITLISLASLTLSAKDRLLVSKPSYALGFAADLVIKNISPSITQKYILIHDEDNKLRVERLVKNIYQFSGHKFNTSNYTAVIIQGEQGEPNAFTSGSKIYITASLCKLLNDRELTAVIAHELAHAERSHLLRRIVFAVGAPVLALYNYAMANGETHSPQEIFANANLGTEIEADCIAAKWLMHMRSEGQWHHAEDLNRATAKIFDGTEYLNYLDVNDPPVVRYWAIKNKLYESDSCGL